MAIPTANTTCDIYRNANAPPAAPDVAGVKIFLSPDFGASHRARVEATTVIARWTHVAFLPPNADVRDGYTPAALGVDAYTSTAFDHVWIPDRNGTLFDVLFVERVGLGTGGDAKRVYLQRQTPTWPTDNL